MRVVLNTLNLVSENLGGAWVYTWQLAKALERFRSDVELIILANEGASAAFGKLQHAVHVVPMDSTNRFRRVAWEQLSMAGELKRYAPHVFHGVGNVLPLRMPVPSVVTIHDFQWYYYPHNFSFSRRTYLRRMVRASARSARHVICVSEATKKDLSRFCGVRDEKVSVIHEAGLDEAEFLSTEDLGLIRRRYGIERPVLLSVGSSLPHKNLHRLIEAFARIVDVIPHDLLIVGESFGYQSQLSQLVEDVLKSHGPRIRFTGYISREDLVGLYRSSDAFVFPSLFEGFGIPAVEAMQCGLPVIASSATSLPEVLEDAGQFFDPMSTQDLSVAIQKVCLDRAYHARLSDLGRERARSFSWSVMAEKTVEAYGKAMPH